MDTTSDGDLGFAPTQEVGADTGGGGGGDADDDREHRDALSFLLSDAPGVSPRDLPRSALPGAPAARWCVDMRLTLARPRLVPLCFAR